MSEGKAKPELVHAKGAALFNQVYEQVTQEVPFKPEWHTPGKKDFANLPVDPELQSLAIGEKRRFVYNRRCKALIVGTDLGPMVVFQRFDNSPRGFKLRAPEPIMELNHRHRGFLALEHMELLLLRTDTLPTRV